MFPDILCIAQALNAYEFERHGNCRTKHPNNHIYFDNGKTIYAVVQELKNTPQDMLFDAIQSVTGSPINQKNFRSWKGNVFLGDIIVVKGVRRIGFACRLGTKKCTPEKSKAQ